MGVLRAAVSPPVVPSPHPFQPQDEPRGHTRPRLNHWVIHIENFPTTQGLSGHVGLVLDFSGQESQSRPKSQDSETENLAI